MVDYVRSDQPTLTITQNTALECLRITVVNPGPSAGKPTVVSNQIYRRATSSTGVWTLAGTVGVNGVLDDTFQRAATSFDYFVVTDTFAESITYTVTTPYVTGFWAYAPADINTLAHYFFTDGTSETLDEQESVLALVGRTYPIVEAGIQETQVLTLSATVPFSDPAWMTSVEWWRLRKREKRTILYRDGRGRMMPCRIIGPVTITPTRYGSTVTASLYRVDYSSSTTTLDPSYYNAGAYNAGGNGAYGNGAQGNGA